MTALRTFACVHPIYYFHGALFAVRTGSNMDYICEKDPGSDGEARAVVEVDPERFLQLWRWPGGASKPRDLAAGPQVPLA